MAAPSGLLAHSSAMSVAGGGPASFSHVSSGQVSPYVPLHGTGRGAIKPAIGTHGAGAPAYFGASAMPSLTGAPLPPHGYSPLLPQSSHARPLPQGPSTGAPLVPAGGASVTPASMFLAATAAAGPSAPRPLLKGPSLGVPPPTRPSNASLVAAAVAAAARPCLPLIPMSRYTAQHPTGALRPVSGGPSVVSLAPSQGIPAVSSAIPVVHSVQQNPAATVPHAAVYV